MNSSVWRDVRSRNGGRSGSGDVIVRLHDGNRIWRVSPDTCPLDLSPSNSVGNAGGGGRPAGMVGTSVGAFLCSDIIFSSHLNLIISSFNCLLVSSSLSCESARACSKATRQSCTESGNACCVGFMVQKDWGGIRNREVHGDRCEPEMISNFRQLSRVSSKPQRSQPSELILFWCKGNCKGGLNQNLAGDPKLIYSVIIMSQVWLT